MPNQSGFTVLRNPHKDIILDRLMQVKGTAYYREGSFSDEIIWEGRKFLFPTAKKKLREGMWVFRSVNNDIKEHLKSNKVKAVERLPVNFWNDKLHRYRGRVTATDVDHAYWRIAFNLGYIKERTYTNGLKLKDKAIRLAALANLSSQKEYIVIKDGILTNKTVILKYNPEHQKVYNNIRYTCYAHMMTMADLLGDEFICYKTDCIYYKDKPQNRELVQTYLDSVGLDWKQLVEIKKPSNEE